MHIFVDESGAFSSPGVTGPRVSCVAGLVVPETKLPSLEDRIRLVCKELRIAGEIKGRNLSEREISRFVTVLERFDVILVLAVVDLALETDQEITQHKVEQAALAIQDRAKLQPGMQTYVSELANRIQALPNQLYLQMQVLVQLAIDIVQIATLEYAQTCPEALGAFRWTIDSKDRAKTEYEDLWHNVVMPSVQSHGLDTPFVEMREGDYSHFRRFDYPTTEEAPEHLRHRAKKLPGGFQSFDIRRIVEEHLAFLNSKDSIGLQLADVLGNAFQRACNGRLRRKGWRNLGRLMIKNVQSKDALRILTLGSGTPTRPRVTYADVFREIEAKARPNVR